MSGEVKGWKNWGMKKEKSYKLTGNVNKASASQTFKRTTNLFSNEIIESQITVEKCRTL